MPNDTTTHTSWYATRNYFGIGIHMDTPWRSIKSLLGLCDDDMKRDVCDARTQHKKIHRRSKSMLLLVVDRSSWYAVIAAVRDSRH